MQKKRARIGVVAMGGSGKTLLLKTLFNSQKVRDMGGSGKTLLLKRVFNSQKVRDMGGSGKALLLKRVFNSEKVRDMGGSDKTLLLKRVFNSQKVRDNFRCGSLLGVTVLHGLSLTNLTSLTNEYCRQIAMQTEVDLNRNMKGKDVKIWLNERLLRAKFSPRFSPFLDDVWEEGKLRRTPLTDHSNSKIIVSSRDDRALDNSIVNSGNCRNTHNFNGGCDGI